MAKSQTQILVDLYEARDKLLDGLAANGAVRELEIRQRRVQFNNFADTLMEVERLISYYEDRAAGRQLGNIVRSRARIGR